MTPKEAVEWAVACGNKYAKAYAKKMLLDWDITDADWKSTQALYILNNMHYCHMAGVCAAKDALRSLIISNDD